MKKVARTGTAVEGGSSLARAVATWKSYAVLLHTSDLIKYATKGKGINSTDPNTNTKFPIAVLGPKVSEQRPVQVYNNYNSTLKVKGWCLRREKPWRMEHSITAYCVFHLFLWLIVSKLNFSHSLSR